MRKLIAFVTAAAAAMAVSAGNVSAADRGHARAGVMAGFTSSSSNVKRWDASSIGRFHLGFTAQIPIVGGFALQPSVLYQAKGSKLNGDVAEEQASALNAKVNYLEIPVQIQWGPDLVAFRPYVFAEPFVGYGLRAKARSVDGGGTYTTSSFETSGLSRWEYGLGLGAGIDVWKLQVSVKYYWNFGSLFNESGKLNDVGTQIKDAFKDGRNFKGVTISLAYMF